MWTKWAKATTWFNKDFFLFMKWMGFLKLYPTKLPCETGHYRSFIAYFHLMDDVGYECIYDVKKQRKRSHAHFLHSKSTERRHMAQHCCILECILHKCILHEEVSRAYPMRDDVLNAFKNVGWLLKVCILLQQSCYAVVYVVCIILIRTKSRMTHFSLFCCHDGFWEPHLVNWRFSCDNVD